MDPQDFALLGGMAAILAILWNLHRDMSNLRERLAHLEGEFDVLSKVLTERGSEGG